MYLILQRSCLQSQFNTLVLGIYKQLIHRQCTHVNDAGNISADVRLLKKLT